MKERGATDGFCKPAIISEDGAVAATLSGMDVVFGIFAEGRQALQAGRAPPRARAHPHGIAVRTRYATAVFEPANDVRRRNASWPNRVTEG